MQVRVSAVLTNGPFLLNLDCDHYINNSKALREAMCFLMDPNLGKYVCYVQFPQRFDGIDRNDRYANRNTVFFDVSCCIPSYIYAIDCAVQCLLIMIHYSPMVILFSLLMRPQIKNKSRWIWIHSPSSLNSIELVLNFHSVLPHKILVVFLFV